MEQHYKQTSYYRFNSLKQYMKQKINYTTTHKQT